ncbi:hypothetical protein N9C96_02690 [bacterium]|nr:hypothetical protein [bacterium]
MRLLASVAVCALLGLTTVPAAAQNVVEWYEAAEKLRRDAGNRGDLQKSNDIHLQLIKQGYSRSLVPYAELQLELGDVETAMRVFEEAANAGNLFAITRVAQLHATGAFGDKSRPEAGVDLLRKLAANSENRRAIVVLAEILAEGQVVDADPEAAMALYQRLPDDPLSLRRMADMYMSGAMGEVDAQAAIPAYEKAMELGNTGLGVRLAEAQLAVGRYDAAMETMEEAIVEQDERALLQLVRWHRDGAFGPLSDLDRAVLGLEELLASGAMEPDVANAFRVALASEQLKAGRYTEAANTIAPAVQARDPRALNRFMRWHTEGLFGPVSDPIAGIAALRELIEDRDVPTAIFASFRLDDPIYSQVLDQDTVLNILAEATEAGDGAATRALARAYRTADIKGPHQALIDRYAGQIDLDDRVIELVYAGYDPSNHRQSRERALELLSSVGGPAFVKGMIQLRSLERTSYVYVLQSELGNLGYYQGSQNGKLTSRTIRAMLDFCRDSGFLDACRDGPITMENSLLIVEAIAQRKRVSS